jgi:hypothetical protein
MMKYYSGNYASKKSATEKATTLRAKGWECKVKPYGKDRFVMYAKKQTGRKTVWTMPARCEPRNNYHVSGREDGSFWRGRCQCGQVYHRPTGATLWTYTPENGLLRMNEGLTTLARRFKTADQAVAFFCTLKAHGRYPAVRFIMVKDGKVCQWFEYPNA